MLILSVLVITGCKELSNDPPEKTGNLVVNLGDIQKQLGLSSSSNRLESSTVPGNSDATNEVKSLLVGAFVVTTRNTPYAKDVAITDEISENLKDELAGSVDYIQIVNLPTDSDTIEFPYPKSDLSRWQVIAVALDFSIKEFAELGEDAHDSSIIYFGFSENFYTAGSIGDTEQVEINMVRACLSNDTVKGCATYSDSIDGSPVVSPAVEILGIRYNAETSDFVPSTGSFPLIIRSATDATNAESYLETVRGEIVDTGNPITSLTVRSTRTKNPAESAACTDFADNGSATVLDLKDNCEVQLNKIALVN